MRRVRLRRRSVLVNAVLAAALITGAGFGYAAVNDDGSSSSSTRTRTGKVARGTVMASVSASGNLSSPSDVGVSFTASGKVTSVKVKVGDTVTAGQVLAEIDPTTAREDLDEAKAAVALAEANVAKAKAGQTVSSGSGGGSGGGSGQSGKALAATSATASPRASATARTTGGGSGGSTGTTGGPGGTPAVTVTVTRAAGTTPSAATTVDAAAVAQAEQALVQARNKLAEAQRVLDGTVLRAPSDGVVASVAGKVGDSVGGASSGGGSGSGSGGGSGGSSQSGGSSTPSGFVVLANPAGMQIKVSFSEADAAKVRAGQPATVTMSVDTSIRLNAKVVSINPLPDSTSSSASAKYSATIAIEGDVSGLRTGQAANVQVVVAQADNALYVPSAAVTGTGTNASVQVVTAGGTQRRTVTVGVVGDQVTEIVSGLEEGDEVVVGTVTTGGGTGGGSGGRGSSGGAGSSGGQMQIPGAGGGQGPGPGGGFPGGGR